jgi:hypothetical protein
VYQTVLAFVASTDLGAATRRLTIADLALMLVVAVIVGIAAGAFAWSLTRGPQQTTRGPILTIGWAAIVFLAVFLAALELWDRL